MNWFNGNIAEAVAQSKAKNAIFVVFVEGKDESTQKLAKLINEDKTREKLESDDFVAIKIESDSQSYMQFASIYQMVPVPSIFFIGKTGAPLEICTGVISTAEELDQKIAKVLAASGKNTPLISASASFISGELQQHAGTSAAASKLIAGPVVSTSNEPDTKSDIVCEGDVCYKKPKETNVANADLMPKTTPEAKVEQEAVEKAEIDVQEQEKESFTSPGNNTRIEETRKLLEQKRRERVEQEKQLEKEQELHRRREGKDIVNLQQWQNEQDLKELKENIRRERLADQTARDRVRAQIAADRAERAKKTAVEAEAAGTANTNVAAANTPQPSSIDTARLQFRLSSGITKTQSFNSQETLSVVRAFVKTDLLPGTGIKDFILATTYPKREFPTVHDCETLVELGLFPSAVILVIGKESSSPAAIIARSGGIVNILSTLFWMLLSPVFSVFGYIRNIGSRRENGSADDNVGAQKRNNEERGAQHEAAKRRNLDRFISAPSTSKDASDTPNSVNAVADNGGEQQKPYRRYGSSNVHRLSDNHKDSDDENATWNGNSTQQQ